MACFVFLGMTFAFLCCFIHRRYVSFQSGVCPICLKSENTSQLSFGSFWTGRTQRCPCCNQTLPRRLVQNLLVERFECVPDIKPTFINASLIHSFPNPQDLSQLAFFMTCLVFFSVGFPAKQNTKISGSGEWYSGDHCNNKSSLS